jgi:hypothetical protein
MDSPDRMTHSQTDHVLTDDSIQTYLMYDHLEELTMSKQAMQMSDMERFSLTKLNNGHMKEQYKFKT